MKKTIKVWAIVDNDNGAFTTGIEDDYMCPEIMCIYPTKKEAKKGNVKPENTKIIRVSVRSL
jgi:hypothetical protein